MTRTRLITAGLAVVVAGAAIAFVMVARGDDPLRAGALLVSPPTITIDEANPGTSLTLDNDGASSVGFEIAADQTWLAAQPSAGVVPRGLGAQVAITADPAGLAAGIYDAVLRVETVDGSAAVPVSFRVGEGVAASGPARLEVGPALRFEATATAVDLRIVNGGAEPLSWEAAPADAYLLLEQRAGEIPGGSAAVVRVSVDRSGLEAGATRSRIEVTSNGGDATVTVDIQTRAIPLLVVPSPQLDFGSEREGEKTLGLEVRNGGLAPLRYQISIGQPWLRVAAAAAGDIAPGDRVEVRLTFLFDEAPFGRSEERLTITSDGGDAVVAVRGVRDTFAPMASDRRMGAARERCSGDTCAFSRTVTATVTDDTDITVADVRFQICSGAPQTEVTCEDYVFVSMRRRSGDTFTAEAGPLPACTVGRSSYILWWIYTEDSVGNVRLLPGSKTPESRPHCRTDGTMA